VEREKTLRPMGLADILDETLDLYRGNLLLFATIAALLVVPFTVIQASLSPISMLWSSFAHLASPSTVSTAQLDAMLRETGTLAGVNVLYLVLYVFMLAALTQAVSSRFLGRPTTLADCYGYVARRAGSFFLTCALVGLLFLGAMLAVVIPVLGWIGGPVLLVVFYFWTAFVPQVFIVEGRKYRAAIRRSRQLAKGHWLRMFVLGLLAGLISYIFQIMGATVGLALAAAGVKWAGVNAISGFFQGAATSLALPIPIVAWIVLYYDIRIRKEGFDLEMLARELTAGHPSPPTEVPEK